MLSYLLATSFLAAHPGRLLDTREYTVVVPNLMGNGVSYSPSRDVPYLPPSPELPYVPPWYVPNLSPPTLLSIADNVAAQHALLQVSPNPKPKPKPKPHLVVVEHARAALEVELRRGGRRPQGRHLVRGRARVRVGVRVGVRGRARDRAILGEDVERRQRRGARHGVGCVPG